MSAASSVQITKVRITRDKNGDKHAVISLRRVLDSADHYTDSIAHAVGQMKENAAINSLRLAGTLLCNLTFWAAAGLAKPSEILEGTEIGNFRLDREVTGPGHSYLTLTYDFELKLDLARRWIIATLGDDILCVLETSQLSFPKAGDDAKKN